MELAIVSDVFLLDLLSHENLQFSFMLWVAVDHEHNEDDPGH